MLRRLCFALLTGLIILPAALAQTPTVLAKAGLLDANAADIEAVEAVVGLYFQGHATGEGAYFERAFHPDARLFWAVDGELRQRPVGEWIKAMPGRPPEDEEQRRRRIVSLDVTGTAATVKVELDYPGALIHDYFSLVKADGRWQIVNKAFTVARRAD